MENKACIMQTPRKKFTVLLFIICSTLLFFAPNIFAQNNADSSGSFIDIANGRFIQRLSWKGIKQAESYEITVQKNTGSSYEPAQQIKTFTTFIDLSLSPGQYRYQVRAFDVLARPGTSTPWINFEVIAVIEPVILEITPDPYTQEVSNKADMSFSLKGQNLISDAEVYLIKTMNAEELGSFVRSENLDMIKPLSYKNGNDNKTAEIVFASADLNTGIYELHIKPQVGVEAIRRNIIVYRVAPPLPPPITINSIIPYSKQLPDIPKVENVDENAPKPELKPEPFSITFTINGSNFPQSAKVFLRKTLKMEGGALLKSEPIEINATSFTIAKDEKSAAAVFNSPSGFGEGVYDLYITDQKTENREAVYYNISLYRYVKPSDPSQIPVVYSASPSQLQIPNEKILKTAGIVSITFKITGNALPQVASARLVQTAIIQDDGSLTYVNSNSENVSEAPNQKIFETKNYKVDADGKSGEIIFSSNSFDIGLFDLAIRNPWGDDFFYRNIRLYRIKEPAPPPPDTRPVIASFKPETITLPYENQPGKKPKDYTFVINAKNLSPEADVYLVQTMNKDKNGRYEHNQKNKKINAITLTIDKSGTKADIVFKSDAIEEGIYDFYLINPSGEETVYRNISVMREPPPPNNDPNIALKPDDHFDISAAIGYTPLIPQHGGRLNEYFGEPWFPMGASIQIGVIPFQHKHAYFGFETHLAWHYLFSDRGDASVTMPFVSGHFAFLLQLWTFNKQFAINIRAGGGATLAYDMHVSHYSADIYWVDDKKGSWLPSLAAGLSFRLRTPSPFFFDLGAEYVIILSPEPPYSSFIRPAFMVGIQG
jgi:hypothetical protein